MSVGRSDKFLLIIASTVILGTDSRETRGHILVSHDIDIEPVG
jgi:hypothetical protein